MSAARLLHDVGKYIARTARNVSGPALDGELLAMLLRDLYALGPHGERASTVFSRGATFTAPALDEVREQLAAIDALEPRVRAGEPDAVARAVQLACAVEATLRALAQEPT